MSFVAAHQKIVEKLERLEVSVLTAIYTTVLPLDESLHPIHNYQPHLTNQLFAKVLVDKGKL